MDSHVRAGGRISFAASGRRHLDSCLRETCRGGLSCWAPSCRASLEVMSRAIGRPHGGAQASESEIYRDLPSGESGEWRAKKLGAPARSTRPPRHSIIKRRAVSPVLRLLNLCCSRHRHHCLPEAWALRLNFAAMDQPAENASWSLLSLLIPTNIFVRVISFVCVCAQPRHTFPLFSTDSGNSWQSASHYSYRLRS